MRARRVAGWSNVAMASAVVLTLTACGGGSGESEGEKDAQEKPLAATSSLDPSQSAQSTPSETNTEKETDAGDSAELPAVTTVSVTETEEGARVTFTFDAAAPDYLDSYQKTLNGAEGKEIKVKGSKFLRVAFVGVSPDSQFETPDGNGRIPEVRYLTNFESEMSAGIGIIAPDGAADPEYEIAAHGSQVIIDIKN